MPDGSRGPRSCQAATLSLSARPGQSDSHARARAGIAFDVDGTACALDAALHDRETKAGAVRICAILASIESVERALSLLNGHARPMVGHDDFYIACVGSHAHVDGRSGRVLERVVDEVGDRAAQL